MELRRIPNRLKKYRRLAGYSQKTVANVIALSGTSSLSRWEKGRAFPSVPMLFQLSLLYNTHPFHLYQDLWQELKVKQSEQKQRLFPLSEEIINNDELI